MLLSGDDLGVESALPGCRPPRSAGRLVARATNGTDWTDPTDETPDGSHVNALGRTGRTIPPSPFLPR